MPEEYECYNCGQKLDPQTGETLLRYSRDIPNVFVIRCPKCQTENSFELKDK